jgi:hypothetical protein
MKTSVSPLSSASPRGGSQRFKLAAAALMLAFAATHSARATTQYWDVNGSGTWNTSATDWSPNSTGGTDAAFATGNDVIFSSGTITTPTVTITTTSLAANSITFDGSSSTAYTFSSAGTLTLGNASTGNNVITLNSGAGAVTFQGAINLANPGTVPQTYTITNNSSNLLTFGSTFTEGNAASSASGITLSFAGTGGVTFNGTLDGNNTTNPGGNFNLGLAGSQTVSLNAANNTEGIASVNATSTLDIGNSLALQDYNLQMVNSATVNFTGGITAATIAGLGGAGGTLTLTNNASAAVNLTLQGASLGSGDTVTAASPT